MEKNKPFCHWANIDMNSTLEGTLIAQSASIAMG